MLEEIKGLMREHRNRVKKDEVVDRLSFNVWKTCNRILEEVEAVRRSKGEVSPPGKESFWYSSSGDTRNILTNLFRWGIVEFKGENELTATESAWASRSDSNVDALKAALHMKMRGSSGLPFYRLVKAEGKRNPKGDELPDGVLDPIVVR